MAVFDWMLKDTASVQRLKQGTGVQSIFTVESTERCLIQPVTGEFASVTDMVYGRTYYGFFRSGADVQIADKIVDQNGREFHVTGIMLRDYGGSPHLTALMTEDSGGGT